MSIKKQVECHDQLGGSLVEGHICKGADDLNFLDKKLIESSSEGDLECSDEEFYDWYQRKLVEPNSYLRFENRDPFSVKRIGNLGSSYTDSVKRVTATVAGLAEPKSYLGFGSNDAFSVKGIGSIANSYMDAVKPITVTVAGLGEPKSYLGLGSNDPFSVKGIGSVASSYMNAVKPVMATVAGLGEPKSYLGFGSNDPFSVKGIGSIASSYMDAVKPVTATVAGLGEPKSYLGFGSNDPFSVKGIGSVVSSYMNAVNPVTVAFAGLGESSLRKSREYGMSVIDGVEDYSALSERICSNTASYTTQTVCLNTTYKSLLVADVDKQYPIYSLPTFASGSVVVDKIFSEYVGKKVECSILPDKFIRELTGKKFPSSITYDTVAFAAKSILDYAKKLSKSTSLEVRNHLHKLMITRKNVLSFLTIRFFVNVSCKSFLFIKHRILHNLILPQLFCIYPSEEELSFSVNLNAASLLPASFFGEALNFWPYKLQKQDDTKRKFHRGSD